MRCEAITGYSCNYLVQSRSSGSVIAFLEHFNETHDRSFLPRCKDDLLVEYGEIVDKIHKLMIE